LRTARSPASGAGWDVVHAMSVGKVNELFDRQFVDDLAAQSTLPPITGTIPIVASLSMELVDLVLGDPLIRFDPTLEPQTARLTIPIISGLAHLVAASGSELTVLSTQWISEADGYTVTGLVPLASVEGEVDKCDIVLQIDDGHGFASDLAVSGAAGTVLGEFFLSFLQQHAAGYRYSLGTLVTASNGTNLTPQKSFRLATQVDVTDPTDPGRVLLFIPTEYIPGGGSQTVLQLADVIPAGMDTTLFVASGTLFGGIIKTAIAPVFADQMQAGTTSTGASYLQSAGALSTSGRSRSRTRPSTAPEAAVKILSPSRSRSPTFGSRPRGVPSSRPGKAAGRNAGITGASRPVVTASMAPRTCRLR